MSLKVPLLDLHAQYRPLREEILAAMTRVVDSQRFILGPEVEAFESEMAAMLGTAHAVAVSSGTDALLLALLALEIGPDDEVITSTYSFFASVAAIVRVGARPVLVDIEPDTFNLDCEAVAARVTSRTKAILPVHLFGLSADLDALIAIANARGIRLVEDAAQSIGATFNGRRAGTVGAFGCFSFFPSKNLGAFGDAGLLTTNDPGLAERARMLRTHGMKPKYVHHAIGGNFRMDALQAAVLRIKAPHLERWTNARRQNAARYATLFHDAGLTDRVTLPIEPAQRRHVFNQFVIRTSDRDALKDYLETCGIGTEVYYPVPFHRQPCLADVDTRSPFPHADRAAATSLALPIYGELTAEQQAFVVDTIAAFINRTADTHAVRR